jgi:hypothetical protein
MPQLHAGCLLQSAAAKETVNTNNHDDGTTALLLSFPLEQNVLIIKRAQSPDFRAF